MDEQPNVNNLNGVPNFGHGLPEGATEEEVVAADPEAPAEAIQEAPEEKVAEAPMEGTVVESAE